MGFFKSLLGKVGVAIGDVLEWVGSKTHIQPLESAGLDFRVACDDWASRIVTAGTYDTEVASVEQTTDIIGVLNNFNQALQPNTQKIEQTCIQICQEYFEKVIAGVADSESTIQRDRLDLKCESISKNIQKILNNHLSKRVSIDDEECLIVLQIQNDDSRKNKIKDLGDKVIEEALHLLVNEIRNTVKITTEEILNTLKNACVEKENELVLMQRYYNEMIEKQSCDVKGSEQEIISPLVMVEATKLVRYILS